MYFVDVFCGCILWVYFVNVFCGCILWMYFVGVFCGCILWMYFVDVFCGCILWMYFVDVFCGCILWMYIVDVMTYKCLHGLAPPYLSGRFTSVSDVPGRSMLRSNTFDRQQLLLPRTKTATIGPRGFYYAGPHSWNSLPVVFRN